VIYSASPEQLYTRNTMVLKTSTVFYNIVITTSDIQYPLDVVPNRMTKNFIVLKKKNLYNTHTPHDKPIERDYAVER
jgi:hypothetical protein